MHPDRRAGRFEGRHALRQQPGDDAGKHVAGTGRRQQRRAVGVDRRAAVGRGDHRVRPLVDRRPHLPPPPPCAPCRAWTDSCRRQGRETAGGTRPHAASARAPARRVRWRPSKNASRRAANTVIASASKTMCRTSPAAAAISSSAKSPTFSCVPSPGPKTSASGLRSAQELQHVLHRAGLAQDDRGQMRGIDGKRIGRRQQR